MFHPTNHAKKELRGCIASMTGEGEDSHTAFIRLRTIVYVYLVRGVPGSYKIFNLNVTLDKLQQGSYEVQVACRNRQLGSGNTLVY